MNVPKTCIDCSVVIRTGTRCAYHKKQRERARNKKDDRQKYRDKLYRSFVMSDRCQDCGSPYDLTRDHIIPLSKGGTNDHWNLRTLCRSCNSMKGSDLMQ